VSIPEAIVAMNDRYDALTVEVINRACGPGSHCVDIGAGTGDILRHMVAASPLGRHIAVEPLPQCAERLYRDFGGVVVWQMAASDQSGTAPFVWVSSNPGYSGLRRRPYEHENETLENITVATARLDDLVPTTAEIAVIKVDVEGGELGVLRGATGILRRCRPLIVLEHGGDHVTREYQVTTDDLWGYLTDLGYRLWTLPGFVDGDPALDRTSLDRELRTHWYYVAAHADSQSAREGTS
jgi:FkbM family methyltransferase